MNETLLSQIGKKKRQQCNSQVALHEKAFKGRNVVAKH